LWPASMKNRSTCSSRSSEPALCVVFAPDNRAEFERACAVVGRFVALNVELFTLVEEIGAWEDGHGRGHCDRGDSSIRTA
jgi:hypothetical protein